MGRKEKTFERKLRPVALVAAERPKNSLHLLSDENDHDNGYGGGGRGRWALTGAAGDANGGVGGGRSNSRERGKGNKRRGGAGVEEEEEGGGLLRVCSTQARGEQTEGQKKLGKSGWVPEASLFLDGDGMAPPPLPPNYDSDDEDKHADSRKLQVGVSQSVS
jgi:hypothetical protein